MLLTINTFIEEIIFYTFTFHSIRGHILAPPSSLCIHNSTRAVSFLFLFLLFDASCMPFICYNYRIIIVRLLSFPFLMFRRVDLTFRIFKYVTSGFSFSFSVLSPYVFFPVRPSSPLSFPLLSSLALRAIQQRFSVQLYLFLVRH